MSPENIHLQPLKSRPYAAIEALLLLLLLLLLEEEEEEEAEENLFAFKKAGCQKGLQPIDAGYRTHNKTKNRPNIHRHYIIIIT